MTISKSFLPLELGYMSTALTKTEPAAELSRPRTGILPCRDIREMIRKGDIAVTKFTEMMTGFDEDQVQPASIDLRLGDVAYPVDTSFLPGGVPLMDKMASLDARYNDFKLDLRSGAVLEKNRVYVIPLLEEVRLKSDIKGFANPKSSTGRLDILTRLITDHGTAFDEVPRGYEGRLYLEVVPRSFSVVVKRGTRFSQLRFRKSETSPLPIAADEWNRLLDEEQIVRVQDREKQVGKTGDLRFTVDLYGAGEGGVIGWRAKKHTRRIDLERRDYDPLDFWEPIRFHKSASLILDPDEFYILMTKEAIAVPPDYAAEMVPYDTRAGRIPRALRRFFRPRFRLGRSHEKSRQQPRRAGSPLARSALPVGARPDRRLAALRAHGRPPGYPLWPGHEIQLSGAGA